MKKNSNLYYLALIAIGFAARLLPHPPNFTPLGAIAFFAGDKLSNKRIAFAVPILILAVSDFFLGWHGTFAFVYASFLITTILGCLKPKNTWGRLMGLTVSSILFFLITNMGVWLTGNLYPMTLQGLVLCYGSAIPFFRNEIAANLIYGGAFYLIAWLVEGRLQKTSPPISGEAIAG